MTFLQREPVSRTAVLGRLMTCTCCGAHVDVIELPAAFVDPSRYRCPDCTPTLAAISEHLDTAAIPFTRPAPPLL